MQLPVLPGMVGAHQLWLSLHSLPAHASETIPPEAVALFREFLVSWGGCVDSGNACVHSAFAR
jgi:hypothetical protein